MFSEKGPVNDRAVLRENEDADKLYTREHGPRWGGSKRRQDGIFTWFSILQSIVVLHCGAYGSSRYWHSTRIRMPCWDELWPLGDSSDAAAFQRLSFKSWGAVGRQPAAKENRGCPVHTDQGLCPALCDGEGARLEDVQASWWQEHEHHAHSKERCLLLHHECRIVLGGRGAGPTDDFCHHHELLL